MDTMTKEQRSRTMSRIRSTGTKPELRVARMIREWYRDNMPTRPLIRVNDRGLPGAPDIVLPRMLKIVFVNGCFWHGHAGCYREPKTNKKFWRAKISANKARDARTARKLRRDTESGPWSVMTVWECETRDELRLAARLSRFLSA